MENSHKHKWCLPLDPKRRHRTILPILKSIVFIFFSLSVLARLTVCCSFLKRAEINLSMDSLSTLLSLALRGFTQHTILRQLLICYIHPTSILKEIPRVNDIYPMKKPWGVTNSPPPIWWVLLKNKLLC